MKRKTMAVLALVLALSLGACGAPEQKETEQTVPQEETKAVLPEKKYADLRYVDFMPDGGAFSKRIYRQEEYWKEYLYTYTFNEGTVFEGAEEEKARLLEEGKDPGLGVRALHERGITGRGVNVAIIDSYIVLDHPEYRDCIAAYHDCGSGQENGMGSTHGPAVLSLLAGKSIGTAPEARVYYAAAADTGDAETFADALYWIIEESGKLPEGEKIRAVSVSAAPSSAFDKNTEMWEEAVKAAREAGILVVDTNATELQLRRSKETGEMFLEVQDVDIHDKTGIFMPGSFAFDDRADLASCTAGLPTEPTAVSTTASLSVPCCYRTVAEEYRAGEPSYAYYGEGGLSWGVPYGVGVMALGWQLNPTLTGNEIVQYLFDTAAPLADGNLFIDPAAFIHAIETDLAG